MSAAADALHPALVHHIVNSLGWPRLRPLQEAAVAPLLAGEHALLVAPTPRKLALLRHGVRPLHGVTDATLARRMAIAITLRGVATWMGLLMLLVMTISLVMGWR